MTLQEYLSSLKSIRKELDFAISKSTYPEYSDLSGLDIDFDSPEDCFLWDELQAIVEKMDSLKDCIDAISKPVKFETYLYCAPNGRYRRAKDDFEYTSGNAVEALVLDEFDGNEKWVRTRIEFGECDYYLYGYRDINLSGVRIRVRE